MKRRRFLEASLVVAFSPLAASLPLSQREVTWGHSYQPGRDSNIVWGEWLQRDGKQRCIFREYSVYDWSVNAAIEDLKKELRQMRDGLWGRRHPNAFPKDLAV